METQMQSDERVETVRFSPFEPSQTGTLKPIMGIQWLTPTKRSRLKTHDSRLGIWTKKQPADPRLWDTA